LTLEHGTLVVGAPTLSRDLQNLLAGITGYQVEIRLMDEDITNSLLDALQPDLESQDDRGFIGGNVVSLHDFLLSAGILDEDYLQDILKKAEKKSKSLPEALLNAMVINELDLVELYSILSGIPYISLEYFQFQNDLINKIPAELCIRHTLLPLFETDRDVWIGISDPTDCAAFHEIERITKKRAWPVLAPKTLLATTIRRFYQYHRQHTDSDEIFAFADQLVQEGLFNQADAFQVVRWVVDEKIPFDRAVLRLGHIRSDALYQSLAKILKINLAKIDLTETIEEGIDALGQKILTRKWQESIDVDTAKLIDLSTAQRLMVIPISQGPVGIVVAFADPFYTEALEELSSRFHQKIIPCLAPRETIEAAIQRILGQKNLGTALLTSGLITLNQLNNGLALSRKTNIRLGKALVHRRFITEQQLYQFLAQQAHLPLFDLSKVEIDGKTARILDADLERRYGMLPLASDETSVLLAVVDPLNADAISTAEKQTQRSIRPVLVTEQDFDDAMERIYRDDYLAKSTLQLLERSPEDSAYRVLSRSQVIVLAVLAAMTLFWIVIDYRSLLVVANCFATLFYLLFSIYKGYLIAHAINNDLEVQISEEEVAALDDRDLPIYTVLVPVYKEANVLPNLIERLEKLDYPAPKLDVKVLLEADDQDTINAFFACNPPDFIKGIVVPSAQPKTKPKACNYGLIHARGDYLVIYDAEDRPDPDQLKRSVLAYQKVPPEVVCIQAKLNYYNRNQNLLTQWFTSEYSMWFDLLLPGLDAANAPIPLGGTSNHFKTFSLIEAGAWDPHNVTEDADLGIRLYKRGYRTRIMDSTTYEEANSQTNNWIRQRSRWIKGYIQTWLVHMRHPLRLIKDIGLPAFFSFQLLIGGTFFALLMNPIYWMMTSAWYFFHLDFIQSMYPGFIFYIGAFCLYIGNFAFTYANVAGAMRRKYYDMVESAIFSPLYWGLMSIAAWKGFIQLIRKPHFWEKTTHGLDQKAPKASPGTETV
jgi:cellulose synthase/poly-beta-1,6-N-acetylglucosamine synthase-like glycosyltransferase/type II secretory ATPase GspE/PulE/Tfp pilus assembly ATPase PilB-like protein